MKRTEIQLDDVTYQVNRVFAGSKTVSEVLVGYVVDRAGEETAVDVSEISAV